jgi:tetratricopeptide (TPR) repeat protein
MFLGLVFFTWDETPRRRNAGLALGAGSFVCGLLSKESAFAFPALVALATAMLPPKSPSTAAQRWMPFTVCATTLGLYAALRSTVLSFGTDTESRSASFSVRIVETLQSFSLYIKLLFAPANLHMERTLAGVPGYTTFAGGVLLALILVLIAVCYRTGRGRAAFGFAWFLATWLPISGLFPLNAPMAEHWMYVPMAGFFWGVAELGYETASKASARVPVLRWAALTLVGVWLIGFVAVTVLRNRDWRSNEALYVATLRENPDSVRVQFNLAVAYQDLLDNPAGAIRQFENVVAAYQKRKAAEPDSAGKFWADEMEAYLSLGDLYRSADRIELAIPRYQTLLTIQPDAQNTPLVARAAYGLGRCYLAIGEYSAALGAFRRAAALAPELGAQAERDIAREAPLATFAPAPGGTTNP